MKLKNIIIYTLAIAISLIALNSFMKYFSIFLYNYEDELRELAVPLEKQYFTYLQENKSTPSTLESVGILKTAGCEKVTYKENTYDQEFKCLYEGRNISIEYSLDGDAAGKIASRKNLDSGVYMTFYNSVCTFGFGQKGEPRRFETGNKLIHEIKCRTSANFSIRH